VSGSRFDELSRNLAAATSRRAAVKVLGAGLIAALAGGLTAAATRADDGHDHDDHDPCDVFCAQLPDEQRDSCRKAAEQSQGPCYDCGPKGNNHGLCAGLCCQNHGDCLNGHCLACSTGQNAQCAPVCSSGQSAQCAPVCTSPQTLQCVAPCTPKTTCPTGACGTISDGCGGTLTCSGTCSSGQKCCAGVCAGCCAASDCPAPSGGGMPTCTSGRCGGSCPSGRVLLANNSCAESCSPTNPCSCGGCGLDNDGHEYCQGSGNNGACITDLDCPQGQFCFNPNTGTNPFCRPLC
jgi:hypothetical protein